MIETKDVFRGFQFVEEMTMSLTERGNYLERAYGGKGKDFNFVHIEFVVPWNIKVETSR